MVGYISKDAIPRDPKNPTTANPLTVTLDDRDITVTNNAQRLPTGYDVFIDGNPHVISSTIGVSFQAPIEVSTKGRVKNIWQQYYQNFRIANASKTYPNTPIWQLIDEGAKLGGVDMDFVGLYTNNDAKDKPLESVINRISSSNIFDSLTFQNTDVTTEASNGILYGVVGGRSEFRSQLSSNAATFFRNNSNKVFIKKDPVTQVDKYYLIREVREEELTGLKYTSKSDTRLNDILYWNVVSKLSGMDNSDLDFSQPTESKRDMLEEGYVYNVIAKAMTVVVSEVVINGTVKLADNETRRQVNDAQFDMFTIPYDPIVMLLGTDGPRTSDPLVSRLMANKIATALGGTGTSFIKDLQILPYCPCPDLIKVNANTNNKPGIVIPNDPTGAVHGTNAIFSQIRSDKLHEGSTINDIASVVIYCNSSQFDFSITDVSIPKIEDPLERKIANMSTFYRLCSPGYTSMFQFNPQMNDGVYDFKVQCVYQPYNPFIRIAPTFNNLYGIDTPYDSKGLILKGDFQLPMIDDAWTDYQIQNKNYMNIFDREIQNMELTQDIERKQQKWQIAAGTMSAMTSGAGAGAMAGGPIGAAIGGVAAAGASLAAGIADYKYSDILRGEALDYKQDMFGFNNGNIQALPSSLSKATPLSQNNPIWPILEKYTCKEAERENLLRKIKYNGMSVDAIGTIEEYIKNKIYYNSEIIDNMYFKGKLVRVDNIYGDSHIANAISNELNRGIYL